MSVGKDALITHAANGTEVARSGVSAFSGGCILAVTGSAAESGVLIWARSTENPAAGVKPASWTLSITATDAKTYKQRWSRPLVAESPKPVGCVDPEKATVTKNEQWLAYGQWVVNLADGTSRALGDGIVPRAVGNTVLVFDGVCANCLNGMKSVPVTDPASGRTLFSFPDMFGPLSDVPGDFATSSDGSTLFIARRVSGHPLGYALQSRSLATGAVNWEKRGTSYTGLVSQRVKLAEAAGVVAMPDLAAADETGRKPDEPQRTLGLAMADGKQLWSLPGVDACAANGAGIEVKVNGQLAVLDPRTGHQIAYTPDRSDCGTSIGEYAYYRHEGAVIRILPSSP